MQTPLQITAHDLTLANAVETDIREKAAKFERYYPRLISCHVVVGAPVRSAPRLFQPDRAVPREH